MKPTTVTHVSLDGVMQGSAGRTRTAQGRDSSAADGPCRSSTTRPRRFSTRSSSAPTRSCSAGGPTRSLPATGESEDNANHRSGVERAPEVPGVDHAHRPAVGGHDRPLRRRRGCPRRAGHGGRGAAGAMAAAPGPLAARQPARRRDHPAPLSHRPRTGRAAVPATGPDAALELVDSRSTPKGITIQVYRPAGARSTHRPRPTEAGEISEAGLQLARR